MSDIMLDIETLGTDTKSVMLSIGACEFDQNRVVGHFERHIDITDSIRAGGKIDGRTILWWLGQSKEAQQALLDAKCVSLESALLDLSAAFDWEGKNVWCNGASFDFAILKSNFDFINKSLPWAYYSEMDMRTIKGILGKVKWRQIAVAPDLAHSALSDAIAQAKSLQRVDMLWERDQVAA